MPKDPVCLMDVGENTGLKKEFDKKTYYFCSRFCLEKFEKDPRNYLVRHRDFLDKSDS